MCPTRDFDDRAGLGAGGIVQRLEPGIAVGLEQAGEAGQVRGRMLAATVGAVEVGSGGSRLARERAVVAHVDPQAPGLGSSKSRRQHRHGGVVAVDLLGGEDVLADRRRDRIEQPGRLANPVGQRRAVEFDAVAGVDLGLTIEREVIAVLRHQQVCQGGRCRAPARRRHRRWRRLGDGIAGGAGVFRPDVADDLEVPGNVVQHFRDVLAEFAHLAAARGAGAGTVVGRLMHDLLARQMLGQRLALRPGALGRRRRRRRISGLGAGGVGSLAALQFLQPQFELLDLATDPLR